VAVIEPHYYVDRPGKRGRKAKPLETMLRMYLLQVWFSLSDEGVEDAVYDSYAMRRFLGWTSRWSRSRTRRRCCISGTCWRRTTWGEKLFAAQNEVFEPSRAGSCGAGRSWTRRSSRHRRRRRTPPVPGTRRCIQTKKGNQWYFGMKAHIGVDAGTGYVHTRDGDGCERARFDEAREPGPCDDEVVYADAGVPGCARPAWPETPAEHLSTGSSSGSRPARAC
jgi:IS5 family transposase